MTPPHDDPAVRSGLPLVPRWLRVLVVLIAISSLVYFSIQPAPGTGGRSYGPVGLVPYSMWLHFTAYLGLSGILSYASHDVAKPAWQIMIGVFVVTVGIGTAVEILQLNLPARTFSTTDIGVNALGAATGTILFYISERVLRRLRTATRSSTRL